VGAWRSEHPVTPSLQRVLPDGTVQVIATSVAGHRLVAPNDLVFGADGSLRFTDPSQPFDPEHQLGAGRIFSVGGAPGDLCLVDVGGVYCNGIAVDSQDRVVWAESYTRRICRLGPDGPTVLTVLPEGQTPDGLAVAADGRMFVAGCASHGVAIVGPEGEHLGFVYLDDDTFATNCCFSGSDLWVTDFTMSWLERPGSGRLWRVPTDAVGAPVHKGRLRPAN
jgi:gluconolactonase